MCTTLVLSLGSDVPSSSALGSSAFCKTLTTLVPVLEKNEAPKTSTSAGYHTWAKLLLPYYQKLATEATGKSKVVATDLATYFGYYTHASSIKSIEAYVAAHHAKFLADTKAFAAEIEDI